MTWAELINLALKDSGVVGVGQSALPEDTNDTRLRLNMMLKQWRSRRWLVYHLIDVSCTCDGSLFYEIGPGEVLDTPRPVRIESAFTRQTVQSQPNQVDYPMRQIMAREDYNLIALKRLNAGPPAAFFYDASYPAGKVYPYPLPSSQFELHVTVMAALDEVGSDLQADALLPDAYYDAIYWNLVVRLRDAYDLPPKPVAIGMANAALATIRSTNFSPATLNLPVIVSGRGGGSYNIYSDGN